MKKIWNISLFFVFLISVLMIVGQGFVVSPLNDFVEIALRTMAAFSIQLLACRIGKRVLIKSIPLIATTGFALRGMWWFFNSRYWGSCIDSRIDALPCPTRCYLLDRMVFFDI